MKNIDKKQIDLIKESICVYTKYVECRNLFKEGRLCFENIEEFVDDKGRSCLFRLKEMGHELFRNSDEAHYREKLYDITVGYIFHEAMKLRENLYQLEFYRPSSVNVSDKLTDSEKKIVREIESLTKKTQKRLKEEIKEVKVLTMELMAQMTGLIKLYKDNYLLPRFIYENERIFLSIYGKKEFEGLLANLYGDGKTVLPYKTAKSYLTSEYYDIARLLFRKVAVKDKENKSALFLYMYSSAFYFYFKNRFSKSLMFLEQAKSIDAGIGGLECYRGPLEKLAVDLSREMRKTRNL